MHPTAHLKKLRESVIDGDTRAGMPISAYLGICYGLGFTPQAVYVSSPDQKTHLLFDKRRGLYLAVLERDGFLVRAVLSGIWEPYEDTHLWLGTLPGTPWLTDESGLVLFERVYQNLRETLKTLDANGFWITPWKYYPFLYRGNLSFKEFVEHLELFDEASRRILQTTLDRMKGLS